MYKIYGWKDLEKLIPEVKNLSKDQVTPQSLEELLKIIHNNWQKFYPFKFDYMMGLKAGLFFVFTREKEN